MNVVILSRQLRALAPFEEWLGSAIHDAHLFCDESRVEGYVGFRGIHPFADYEENARVELDVLRLNRTWPIDRIVATSEADVLRAARLRTHLGLEGQGGESAFAFRNKLEMKRRLLCKARSVRIPEFAEVNEAFDVIRFVEQCGYPVIVKPVDGAGAVGTTVIRNEADLASFLENGVHYGLEVERFISGDFYHVDGLILDRECVLCWPSKYVRDYFIAASSQSWSSGGGFTGSHMLGPDNPLTDRMRNAAREILAILPTPKTTSFHLELFHTPDDELYFCEIASRTGGALVNPTLELAFGLNLTKSFVRGQAGLPVDVANVPRRPNRLFGWGLLPPRPGVFAGHVLERPEAPWVRQFQWTMKKGKRSEGPQSAVDQVASFIVELEQESQGTDRLVSTWQWGTENAVWEP